ncbi:MAG: hypothetical protein XXXJIFNMEKO3_LKCDNKCA_00141 (plasmid) [Candidatus Erwinia impunctatus]
MAQIRFYQKSDPDTKNSMNGTYCMYYVYFLHCIQITHGVHSFYTPIVPGDCP